MKSPCWQRVSNLWPSNPYFLLFAAVPFLHDLAIFMALHGWAPFKWLFSNRQQAVRYTVQTFPEPIRTPWKSLPPVCLAFMLPQHSPVLVFGWSTWSSQAVCHPSTIQAQCCLISVFECELVFPIECDLLTLNTYYFSTIDQILIMFNGDEC